MQPWFTGPFGVRRAGRLPRLDFDPAPAAVDGAVETQAGPGDGEPAAKRRFEGDPAGLRWRGQRPPVAAGVVADEEGAEVAGGVARLPRQGEEIMGADQREGDLGNGREEIGGAQTGVAPGPPAVGRPDTSMPVCRLPGPRRTSPSHAADSRSRRRRCRIRRERAALSAANFGRRSASRRRRAPSAPSLLRRRPFRLPGLRRGRRFLRRSPLRRFGSTFFEEPRCFGPGRPALRRPGRTRPPPQPTRAATRTTIAIAPLTCIPPLTRARTRQAPPDRP